MSPEDIHMDDEFMDSLRLNPEDVHFVVKGRLKKGVNDLSESQIEYLSVASLENDLSPEQNEELRLNLAQNEHNRRIFNLIQKTRLVPPDTFYNHKSVLKKLSAGQRLFRITITGLSAAATVAVLIISYILINGREDKVARDQLAAGNFNRLTIEKNEPIRIAPVKAAIKREAKPVIPGLAETTSLSEHVIAENKSTVTENTSVPAFSAVKVPSVPAIDFKQSGFSLLASNNVFSPSIPDDDRGRIRKFIATTFRQKVLGEKEFSDVPLKPYEVALAGIDGLNKLLNWDMQLKESRDESGAVRSVSFSSALLSFNAPVKKSGE